MSALRTAVEIAVSRDDHPIPPITDPLGKHWDQPARREIEIDATHAMMSQETFQALGEYSCSMPTGVYPGKMWRCHVGAYDPNCKPSDRFWQLRWFGHHADPGYVSNHYRRIMVV